VDRQFNTFERARPAETVPLARPREAVQLMADCELLATQAGWVLLEQVALRPHQAGGVIVLHLLLKRTGRRLMAAFGDMPGLGLMTFEDKPRVTARC